jgi:serine/threonine protein kinase
MTNMFFEAAAFTSDLSSWQVQYGTGVAKMLEGTRALDDYGESLPCWYTGTTCPLSIAFTGDHGARKLLPPSLGVSTVDPTKMSAINTYRVGTAYRIAPLTISVEANHTYSLVNAPDGFYINPSTGVILATFGADDVTSNRSTTAASSNDPLKVTLQVIADAGDRRAEVETYLMHVQNRAKFKLVLGNRTIDESHKGEYLDEGPDKATIVPVDTPFRIAARRVDQLETVLSEGLFADITFTFKVLDTETGEPISDQLDRVSIKPNGELIGEFGRNEIGKFTIIITAADEGGERDQLEPFVLDVRQLDVDIPARGPNGKGCANRGVPVDDSGNRFDGKFTSCNCSGLQFVGENCDEECHEGAVKNLQTGKCAERGVGIILGASAGAAMVMLLLAVGAVRYHQYKLRMRPIDFDDFTRKLLANGTFAHGQLSSKCTPRELKRSAVVLLEQIGSGAFGSVWKATLDESTATGIPEYQVAAKIVLDDASSEAKASLTTEAAVMAQLGSHKNLVSIIGVVTAGSPMLLILVYCDHGCLQTHLRTMIADGKAVSAAHKLDFAGQTAKGMAHLAGKHFVHRDLAARNVLLASGRSTSNLVCKVADFGLSRAGSRRTTTSSTASEDYYRSQKGVFAVRWTAPEAMETLVFNQASDMWSFGVVLVELAQDGDRPYHDTKSNSDVMVLTMSGKKHLQPPGCSTELYAIMRRCWDAVPRKRPSFTELALELDQLCASAASQEKHGDACSDSSSNRTVVSSVRRTDSALVPNHGPDPLPQTGLGNGPKVSTTNFEALYSTSDANFNALVLASNADFDALVVASTVDFDNQLVGSTASTAEINELAVVPGTCQPSPSWTKPGFNLESFL